MKKSASFWDGLRERVLIVDGAMGTYLHMRGLPEGQCREALNLNNPSLVLSIHEEYLRAGADVLETNTFGANYVQLKRFGLEKRVRDINRAGVQLAREVATHGTGVFVAGSVGPLGALLQPYGRLTLQDVQAIYEEQIGSLVESGVDLLFIETQSSTVEAQAAVRAARRVGRGIPIVCLMTFDREGRSRMGNELPDALYELVEAGADVVGFNCGIGPGDAYDLVVRHLKDFPHPLCVMPNAGYPTYVSGRLTYAATPAYFAEYARLFVEAGVVLIGSCCGTTPEHTAAMARVVKGAPPVRPVVRPAPTSEQAPRPSLQLVEKPTPSEEVTFPTRLRDLFSKDVVVTVAVEPPRGWDYTRVVEDVRYLRSLGVDAVNVGDNPLASLRMSPVALAAVLKREVGLEPIVHFTCRDRNVIALQSELLGAAALGLRVVLALTGEPVEVGEFPKATSVFDVDAVGLIRILRNLNEGRNLAGNPIDTRTHFIIGGSANPLAADMEREVERVRQKVENGASFLVTQPIYDPDVILRFQDALGDLAVDLIVGICPPISERYARFLANEVPGISIPEAWIDRLRGRSREDAERAAVELCQALMERLRGVVQGFYVMLPMGRYDLVGALLGQASAHRPEARAERRRAE
ncbi:Bifunctional homocysteine S-methyltransferase/5,10-methylenetetrahydrofolate reductase [bacterium HR11]|nr:Bifunctional homocysteine S-methyltransferase/5,10-methylenetetrahydrofolate reductase [bacterium HR11]